MYNFFSSLLGKHCVLLVSMMEDPGLASRKQVSSKLLRWGTRKAAGIYSEIVPPVFRPHARAK